MKKISADRVRLALTLFLSYLKIGLFTFGGGYAMIALIEREFVVRKKWINEVELYEIIAIAESTPGPIAINCATFVGYKILGFVGSFLATLAVCIPSFVIIYLISIFYDTFMSLTVIANAFEGIKVGIAIMITTAGVNMIRKAKKNAFAIGIFLLTFAAAVCIDIFSLNFSTIYIILIGAALGIVLQIARDIAAKKKGTPTASSDAARENSNNETGVVKTGKASEIICRDGDYSYGMGEELRKELSVYEDKKQNNVSDIDAEIIDTGTENLSQKSVGKYHDEKAAASGSSPGQSAADASEDGNGGKEDET